MFLLINSILNCVVIEFLS